MPASQVREDRAGVRSLGERERSACPNGHCPVMESSLGPLARAGKVEAQALHSSAIEFRKNDLFSARKRKRVNAFRAVVRCLAWQPELQGRETSAVGPEGGHDWSAGEE